MDDEELILNDQELDDESQQLYEHFRIEVDRGQEPLRIDKFLTEHISRLPMPVSFMWVTGR